MPNILLLDMAIHAFDAARLCLAKPLAVYYYETNPKGSWYASGAAATAIFEFSDFQTMSSLPTVVPGAQKEHGRTGTVAGGLSDDADQLSDWRPAGEPKFLRDVELIEVPSSKMCD
jgi:hypothetical protein